MLVFGHVRDIVVLSCLLGGSLLNATDCDRFTFNLPLKRALVYLFSHKVFVLHSSKLFHAMRKQCKGVVEACKNSFPMGFYISCRASVQRASIRLSSFLSAESADATFSTNYEL